MNAKGRALFAVVLLSAFHCLIPSQVFAENDAGAMRILALSYYQDLDFEKALPALRKAQFATPEDIELNVALLEVLLDGQMSEDAAIIAAKLKKLGAADEAAFGQARVQLQLDNGDRAGAKSQLHRLVNEADDLDLASRAADILIEELYKDRQYDMAYAVAQTAIRRDPDSRYAYRFSRIDPQVTASSGFSVDLAYRLEYDDNVAYPDEDFASGEEDYRHVFIVDALYDRPFGKGWNFYAQGHFLQSLYNQLDQFNQTRISASAAIGKLAKKLGWRFPVEVNHDWLDGNSYRTSLITRPGIYLNFGNNFFSHVYGRLQSDDYDTFPYPEEDRSGDVYGAGVLIAGQASTRFQLHSYLEYNRYDTDGVYWQRDEIVAFIYGEYEFSPQWVAGLALRYQQEDYDNARPVFADRQQDDSKEVYLNLTHKFTEKWRVRGQVSIVDHSSNIAIFDYTRNVYSLSIIRGF